MADTFTITPLGAAVVEAMPNKKKVKAIRRAFKERSICPASAIFDEREVVEWYSARGQSVISRPVGVK